MTDSQPRNATADFPTSLDHLVLATPDLETGMDEIERLLGVRPAIGGRHPGYGTHNALVSLGPTLYLEIVAADPAVDPAVLEQEERGLLFGLSGLAGSRLATWVLRTDAIEKLGGAASAAGVDLGEILSGGRETPDGNFLSWRVSDPHAGRLGGALPFLIDWGDTPHPAATNPHGGDLVGLRIEHPEPELLRTVLISLDAEVPVTRGDTAGLIATIRTGRTEVELR